MHFKERFLRQAEVLQDLYGVAWFQDFAVKTKAYAAIASTDTAAQNKFKDDIFEAVLATGFLCNSNRTRTAPLMLDLQTNYLSRTTWDSGLTLTWKRLWGPHW
ncbi:unnamed protein product [Cylindrotheca closterium]|uniref:Uncharacterized protein n=1 Tax=Cylindrotheca closterium TaxID=2856 RepID=A0AAD2PV28_9STRA|nr:unnamed protein product [Cylindrotheca closterium]